MSGNSSTESSLPTSNETVSIDALEGTAGRLFEAHVDFVKGQLLDQSLSERIEREVDRILDWLGRVTFKEVVDKEALLQTLDECVINYPLEEERVSTARHRLVRNVLKKLLDANAHQGTRVNQVLDPDCYLQAAEKVVDLKRLRDDLIEEILTSSVYTDLISDVLYNGIKGFILEENLLAKLPGVSSLLKVGKWGMSRTLPNLEAFVEGAAKTFISKNIPKTVSLSKRTLEKSLNPDNIRRLAEAFWQKSQEKEISFGQSYLTEKDLTDFATLSESAWFFYRKSEHFRTLAEEFIDYWIEEYGDHLLGEMFTDLGGDRAIFSRQIEKYMRMWLEKADYSGLLDEMVRAQLQPFYASKRFEEALGSA